MTKSLFLALGTAVALASPVAAQQPVPPPVPAPAVVQPVAPVQERWSDASFLQLVEAVEASAAEGLDPADYDRAALSRAAVGPREGRDAVADRAALKLARDYHEGRAPASARKSWHIRREPLDYRRWLDEALTANRLGPALTALLPQTRDYAALRTALAACRAAAEDCATIEANLDRWRWLPRNLPRRYLWVNIAAFRVDLIEDGTAVARHRIIVGKPATKTPVFAAHVTGVTLNPWWNVPSSIIAESVGALVRNRPGVAAARGYVTSRSRNGGLVVRQRPGPGNALGQVKLEMPNPYTVYLHDTPSKSLFDKDVRAFSHGCIRTQDPGALAKMLLDPDQVALVDPLIEAVEHRTLQLRQPVPIFVVYLTAEEDPAVPGAAIQYEDLYRWDGFVR